MLALEKGAAVLEKSVVALEKCVVALKGVVAFKLFLRMKVDLYTMLPSRILYGVWHKQEGSVGGRVLRNGRAIVLQ